MLKEEDLRAIEAGGAGSPPARKRSPAAAAWDKAHLMTMTTKLPTEEARRLQVVCLLEGTTPYHLVQSFLRLWMQMAERRHHPKEISRARMICESMGWDFRRLRS